MFFWKISYCSSSRSPFIGVSSVISQPAVYGYFVIVFIAPCWWPFSHHLSSSSAFLRCSFKQSYIYSCGLLRFLQPSCFFVSDIFDDIFSSFILTMCPAHFTRLLYFCQLNCICNTSPISSLMSFNLVLSTLFTPAISCSCFRLYMHVYCVYAVRAELQAATILYPCKLYMQFFRVLYTNDHKIVCVHDLPQSICCAYLSAD